MGNINDSNNTILELFNMHRRVEILFTVQPGFSLFKLEDLLNKDN